MRRAAGRCLSPLPYANAIPRPCFHARAVCLLATLAGPFPHVSFKHPWIPTTLGQFDIGPRRVHGFQAFPGRGLNHATPLEVVRRNLHENHLRLSLQGAPVSTVIPLTLIE